ncbi:MAG: gliding motility-associated C-terminal domain-containing protein [Bacteroidia bacterium]
MKSKLSNKFNFKKVIQGLFILASLFTGIDKAFATHAAGADLTYTCLGGNQYRIEVTFYRDCGGIAEPANVPVTYKSASLGQNLTVTANKIAGTGQEITVPCATSASACNGGTSIGIRKFVYQATVTLPAAATDWKFSYAVCCRNCAITTIMNPCATGTEIYVESTLNNVAAPGNSSPLFSNIPIAFVCSGQSFNYNHGVSDANGDSLSYEFIAPKISEASNVTFIPPFTATTPFSSSTPFSLNVLTGQISFTPNMVQVGIMAIRVKEYRNGVLIGSVIRDMEVFTTVCANNLPTASGINNTSNYTITACANQQICFDVYSDDADAGQTVTVTTNSGIAAGTYTISGGAKPTLHFCWTPTVADIDLSPQTFTVTVQDNSCPNNGIQTYSYSLNVVAPDFNINATNVSCNGLNNGIVTAAPIYAGPQTYLWNNGATTASISNLAPGTYTATLTNSNGCTISKSVIITQPALLSSSLTQTNISCAGLCNGEINLTVTGGTAAYTYSWTGGTTTQNLSGKCIGTYTVTVTDAKGCTTTQSATLTNVSNIAASIAATNVSCYAGSTGSAILTVAGGVTPYSYLWSNGAIAKDLNGIASGTYTVTVTDGNSCTKVTSVVITQPPSALTSNITSSSNISCYGGANGAIDLTVNGGTSPYTYNWSNGNSNQDLSNLSSGVYTVTVTDAKGCTNLISAITITQPASPLSSNAASTTNVSCFGGNNGGISLTVNGGTTPYNYNWSNGSTSQNLANVVAGTYSVTVTDAKGCSTTKTGMQVTQPSSALTSNTSSTTNVSCYGGNNGSINLSVNGGTTPYSYNWSNGSTSQNLTNVIAGTYSVTVTDAKGCTNAKTGLAVTQPAATLNSAASSTTNVSCFGGNNGGINLTVTGGTTPYSYLWNNGATIQNLSNIPSGNYSVMVTDSKGCTKSVSGIIITQPAASLTPAINATSDVLCFGGTNGSIVLNVTGGTTPYTFNWSNGSTVQNLSNIVAGSYTVSITDAKGCTNSVSAITIGQPLTPLATGVSNLTNVSCYGNATGDIDLYVNGGTAPYTYIWSNAVNTQDLNNVTAGTYTVTVTDAHGCTIVTNSIIINQPAGPLTANATTTSNVNCTSGANGAISLSVTGGTPGYTYNWSNGKSTQNISGLNAGTYIVIVTDNKGCSYNASATVSQPAGSLNSTINTAQNVSCFGGNNGIVNINVAGGTTPYNYQWSNGATTQNLNGLPSGSYTVTITDNNGCINVAAAIVNQPSAALSNVISALSNVSCFGEHTGAIDLTANGGTAPYSYLWSNGSTNEDQAALATGTYTVTVTDANGCTKSNSAISISQPGATLNSTIASLNNVSCNGGSNGGINLNVTGGTSPYNYNWSNGASTQNLGSVAAGIYTVTVADSKGCTTVISGIAVSQPPAALSGNVSSSSNVSCFGGNNGAVNLSATGGTSPYSYQWSNGATTQNISNVSSGTYTVTVTDAKGCTMQIAGIAITQPGSSLTANPSSTTNVSCFGGNNGSLSLTVNGGTTPYLYQWNNGATTQNINNLSSGTYTATVTDAHGCTTVVAGIAVSQPGAALAANTSSTNNVSCFGGNNGNINLSVNGGTLPYSYQWSNGSTTQNITNLSSGNYSVTITDSKGCTKQVGAIVINQPPAPLTASPASISNVNCFGGNNGNINLTVNGGTTPYTYQWSNGATSQNISNLNSGTYTVTVTDNKGCTTQVAGIAVNQPAAALNGLISSQSDVKCFGGSSGIVNLNITGGTTPYSYQWSNGSTVQNLVNVVAGTYSVTVTDAKGCSKQITGIVVNQPGASLSANPSSTNNVSCYGGNNGNISLLINGGTLPYSYQWSNGATTQNISNLISGTYTATITDANGCTTQVAGIAINQPGASVSANASSSTNVSCFGGNNGNINLAVNGGTSPYSYLWSNGATTQNISNLSSGSYTVTVTDVKGCTTQVSGISISQPGAAVTANASTTSNVSCYGGNNGDINLNVNGGTLPYAFQWNNGATLQSLNNLPSGTYTATVTDAKGCTAQVAGIVITQPGASLTANPSSTTNVSCYGGNNGNINLSVNGGTAPYYFQWTNGATTQNLSNIISGTYTVSITDANGCTTLVSGIAINQPGASLSANPSSTTNVNCFGGSNGNINLTVNGGTTPYSYLWNNGTTTQNLSNLSSGTYTVTVSDAKGCTIQVAAISISQPPSALSGNVVTTQNVNCNSGGNGSVALTASGGTAPYTCLWSTGATTQNISGLYSGTYVVTVTDAKGCTVSALGVVSQPTGALSSTINVSQNVNCFGGNNGSIVLGVNGGTSPYSYTWSNGATTQNLNNLNAGVYSVTITDANGCINVTSTIVGQPTAALSGNASSTTNVSCFGGNNGNISLSVNGGTAPYSYQWSNGATTQNLNNLSSGTYTVTVTDTKGCTKQVSGIAINQPGAALTVNPSSTTNVSCYGGSNGNINLTVAGGTAPYSYQWNNGATTQNLINLSSGTYTVTVTDVKGCTKQISGIAINQPGASVSAVPTSTTNVSCYGGNNGNINLTANGGTSPYSYQWSNGATTQNISNLSSGTYTVTVTDAHGCTVQVSGIAINQPGASVTANPSSTTNVSCFGGNNGNINLTANGGTAPYSYQWSNGATTQNLINLSSGTYTVTVTDAHGCTMQVSGIAINQPGASVSATPSSTTNVSCFGGNNGNISLIVNGGTSPYTYQWSNGATTQNLSNLSSGNYSVTVTDANGCTTQVAGIAINQPGASVTATPSSTTNVSCFGGSNGNINLTVNGGTSPYSYQWNNGATTQNLSNLSSGTYTATVTDVNGCTTQVAGIAINQPAASVSATPSSTTNVSCYGGNNGNINLTVNGGTTPYSYQWNNGATTQNLIGLSFGTYTATITDANGCTTQVAGIAVNQPGASVLASPSSITNVSCYGGNNGNINLTVSGGTTPYSYQWNNGETTQNLNNLPNGTYTVTVTDANGCTEQVAGIAINQPGASLTGNVTTTQNVSCNSGGNGSVVLSATGGTAPYSYLWSNGETTQSISGLYSGTYAVTITDDQGCTFSAIGIVSQPAGALASSINVTQNINCFGGNNGAVNLAVSGGTSPYSYNWSDGATVQNLNNLPAGNYSVLITDANGCLNIAYANVQQPVAALNGSPTSTTNVSCFGGNNGNIDLTVIGGTTPYSYQWSNGETTQNLNNLPAGTYTVTVTDANGCTAQVAGIAINQPGASVSANPNSTTNVSCYGGNNGDITLNVNGGTSPYTYQWSNGETTQNINNLPAGAYTVTVTDTNGCTTQVASIAINQPGASVSAVPSSTTNVNCYGGNNGSINLSVNGGTSPYSYQWSNGETTQNLVNLSAGSYTVTVTDINGCSTEVTGIAINQPGASVTASPSATTNVSCYGGNNGVIDLAVNGGTLPYSYLWNNGATTQNISNLAAGTYTVTVTDANGCTTTVSGIAINQPGASVTANPVSTTNVNCFGGNNGDITISVTGGTLPYSYQWNNGATTQNISNLNAGNYTAVITDANGCTTILAGIAVTQPNLLTASTSIQSTVDCFGGKDGEIDLTVNGGTAPYIYYWSNGATTQNITFLPAGTYTATVTDANGCTTITSVTVILQPAAPLTTVVSSTQNIVCFSSSNGSIDISTANGTAPYSYTWSNGMTTEDINGLPAGAYTVTVTDSHGCTTTATAIITQPAAGLLINGSPNNSNCLYGITGSVNVNTNGGTLPYSYLWNTGSAAQNLANISAGTYTVTVTDANGCSTQGSYIVIDNSAFNANASGPTEFCTGESVTLVADSAPLANYQWYLNGQLITGATNTTYTASVIGSYTVTVSNNCGSFNSLPIYVNVHNSDSILLNPDVFVCLGESIQLNVSGGTTFEWLPVTGLSSNNVPDPTVTPLNNTTYTVTVTNDYGCKTTGEVNVGIRCDTLIIPSGYSPNADGVNDYFVIVGIDKYPGNKIWIYNRWGSLIYETHDYDNKWGGISNTPGLYIGKKVPASTYFYVLDLNDGTKPRQGYIVIRY